VGPREMIRNLSTEGRAANLLAGIEAEPGLLRCPRERHPSKTRYLSGEHIQHRRYRHYSNQCMWIKGDASLTL